MSRDKSVKLPILLNVIYSIVSFAPGQYYVSLFYRVIEIVTKK